MIGNTVGEREDVGARVTRDAAIGLVVAYMVTVGICVVALDGDWKVSLIGSLLPAGFAGPFVGVLLTLRSYLAEHAEAPRAHGVLVAGPTHLRSDRDPADAAVERRDGYGWRG